MTKTKNPSGSFHVVPGASSVGGDVAVPEITAILPEVLYEVSRPGVFGQTQIDEANARGPRVVLDSEWADEFRPTLLLIESEVLSLFPRASVVLEQGDDGCGTPWVVVVRYGLSAEEAGREDTYDRHRKVLSVFTRLVSREFTRIVSLRREPTES